MVQLYDNLAYSAANKGPAIVVYKSIIVWLIFFSNLLKCKEAVADGGRGYQSIILVIFLENCMNSKTNW